MFGYFNKTLSFEEDAYNKKSQTPRTLFSPRLFASLSLSVFKFKIFLLICSILNEHAIHIYLNLIPKFGTQDICFNAWLTGLARLLWPVDVY